MGHKQITDAYLLALAVHHRGRLVTFDSRMVALAGEGNLDRDALVILRG
jgi:predicted nucleic acid-binding protein